MTQETTVLLRRWHDGDGDALQELLRDHLEWIRSYVHRRLGLRLRELAETGDYIQDTVVEFLRYGPRIHLSSGKRFRCLLGRIALSVLRGRHRWWMAERRNLARRVPLQRDCVLELEVPQSREASPAQAAWHNEREALIRLALELLEPDEREIIVLHVYEGMTHAEIARGLAVSEVACRQRHRRAVHALHAVVEELRAGRLEHLLDDGEP